MLVLERRWGGSGHGRQRPWGLVAMGISGHGELHGASAMMTWHPCLGVGASVRVIREGNGGGSKSKSKGGNGAMPRGTCVCVPAAFDANTSLCLILLHTNFKVVSSDTTHPGDVEG